MQITGEVVDGAALTGSDADRIGAKAASLVALRQLDVLVPPFACVTSAVWDELVAHLGEELRSQLERPSEDPEQLAATGRAARELIVARGLPVGVSDALSTVARTVAGPGGTLAVRSSAVGEDSAQHSFAGQFDSYLGVPVEDVPDMVLRCFASAFTDRALLYRRVRGLDLGAARMAVVIQRIVESDAAGVAFTVDPVDDRDDRVLVVAGLGLGQGVVDGTVATDTFRLDRDGAVVDRQIATKAKRVGLDGRGAVLTGVPTARAEQAAVTDAELQKIAQLALHVARHRGAPQDVEWALDPDRNLYLLQARPVTTAAGGHETIFDNANLVESFPGITLPLTFSFMRKTYEHNLRGLVRAFGLSRRVAERNGDIFENLVGTLSGHMYYNLSNWYRMFLFVPGFERAVPAFEKAMGFTARDSTSEARVSKLDRLRWLPGQVRVAARLLVALVTLRSRVRAFQATYARLAEQHRALVLDEMEAHELIGRIELVNRELFWDMSVPTINDFFTQQLYAAVGAMIDAWDLGDPVATRNELLCGERGMESVEPVRSLVALVELIAAQDRARELLESPATASEVLAEITSDPELADVRDALRAHIERFGNRSIGELKLETETLSDNPAPLIQMLRNLQRAGRTIETMEKQEEAIRNAAEAQVRRRLRGQHLRRAAFRVALSRCRFGLKVRESARLTRGNAVAMFRDYYRALGDRFVEAGLLERRDDVFLLTVDEVADAVRGASVTQDLATLVALRRAEHAAAARRSLPTRIRTRGMVAAAHAEDRVAAGGGDGTLSGIGCAPGRVRARALVVDEPRADLAIDGEVLVARTTDPGWVFLMVAAAGLVSEQGNVLSHTAIIGRELGIPTVVGVPGATRALAGGVEIELDGSSGTVSVRTDE